jgi:predicted RNA-binding protein associated with RNAse of E/G family
VAREPGCIITLMEHTPLPGPMRIGGDVVLENGSPVVWFTFPGAWHDIGRFHDARGRFTGFYANVLTPVSGLDTNVWRTLDLFLDVWLPADGGAVRVLDDDELERAVTVGDVTAEQARRARREADTLAGAAARRAWPPPVVAAWTLERARVAAGHSTGDDGVRDPIDG